VMPTETKRSRKKDRGPKPEEETQKPGVSRRTFLKAAAALVGTAVAGYPVTRLVGNPEFRAGAAAALKRPYPPEGSGAYEVSAPTLHQLWLKHFQGKEHLFPLSTWARRKETPQGEVIEGSAIHLKILARNCYEAEKREGESFEDYFAGFVDKLHLLANAANLDFITLVSTLQISAENIGGFSEPKDISNMDVNVSIIQKVGVTGARAMGVEIKAVSALAPGGSALIIKERLAEIGVNLPGGINEALPDEGIRHYDLIRFREQPTTGMMDMEPGERAAAFDRYPNTALTILFEQNFPEAARAYKEATSKRERVQQTREEMRQLAATYLERYANRLQPFAEGNPDALNEIGITDPMHEWQLLNYTDAWHKVSEIPTNPEFAYQRTVEHMREEASQNFIGFVKKLVSQQIRNPKFLPFLLKQALNENNTEELKLLFDLQSKLVKYEDEAKQLRVAYSEVLRTEGPHEYNSLFQAITSILVTKRLSDIAGDFNANDRSNLAWHIYKTCAIREIAPLTDLVDDQEFARDITIDPPYAPASVTQSLETFANMLLEAGILTTHPGNDMNAAYHIFEKMFWRDGGVWPNVPPEKWEQILDHFNNNLVNRLFYDFAGLLHDQEKMPALNQIMLEKGLLSRPATEDPHYFFTQLVYLMLDSWHMRRDIAREDWDEVLQYFNAEIKPMIYSKKEVEPGVFKEEFFVGSADYPPIFRAQVTMYNLLYDLNLQYPDSSDSVNILGHH